MVTIAILFGIALTCVVPTAHGSTELEFILSYNSIEVEPRIDHASAVSYSSGVPGVRALLVGAIRFYQLFISTQDMPACNFVPSCSKFGVDSLRHFGVVRGILLTSDRLQRCNSVSTSRYETDYESGLLMDPVQIYQEILDGKRGG